MSKLTRKEVLAYCIGAGKASKVILDFHQDNLCNIGRGGSGCYCLELQEKVDQFWRAGLQGV